MEFGFESFVIALVFFLPGFFTSRLIAARTPAIGKEISIFQETLESLFRSVYIHLAIIPLIFIIVRFLILQKNPLLLARVYQEGIQVYYSVHPIETLAISFFWLCAAFLLALFFGYKWDPIETLFAKLAKKTGTASEDIFYQLREFTVKERESGKEDYQLWIQARLKNGYTYRGELVFAGYRRENLSRELMLTNVKFFPYPVQTTEQPKAEPRLYDFVLIDMANCDSLEVLFGRGIPKKA